MHYHRCTHIFLVFHLKYLKIYCTIETLCWKFDFSCERRKKLNRNIAWLYEITKQIQHLFYEYNVLFAVV